ncbi:DUF58 domain-containing protein, partial [Myxococcota bacterium]|nr:DUF58 domain-containing protein [Myxococcota bacterium]
MRAEPGGRGWARRALYGLDRLGAFTPLTPLGIVTGAGAWWARGYGAQRADFILLSAATFALALIALCLLLTLAAALWAYLGLRALPPLSLNGEVGAPLDTGARLPRFGAAVWPLTEAAARWLAPTGVTLRQLEDGRERIYCAGRGRWSSVTRAIRVADLFGFTAMEVWRRQPAALRVAPATATASLRVALRHSAGEGLAHPDGEPLGDRVEMRRYVAGDPLRFVLWKAYARTRKLLVRTEERAILPQPSTIALFIAGPQDEASAATARACLEQGLLGEEALFAASGADRLTREAAEGVEQLIDSATRAEGQGLAALLSALGPSQLGHCVFFLPASEGPWVDTVLALARHLPRPPVLILTQAAPPPAPPPARGLARLFTR